MSVLKADAARFASLLTSRRFYLALAGVAAIFSEELFGYKIDPDKLTDVAMIISTLIISFSVRNHKPGE